MPEFAKIATTAQYMMKTVKCNTQGFQREKPYQDQRSRTWMDSVLADVGSKGSAIVFFSRDSEDMTQNVGAAIAINAP